MTDTSKSVLEMPCTTTGKATVIGLYGISGCGKTTLLNHLKQRLPADKFAFYDGSEAISSVVPGGMAAFQQLAEDMKRKYRELAIRKIKDESAVSGQAAIVAGHYMFWEDENAGQPELVSTPADWDVYTHVVYLHLPAKLVADRRRYDLDRRRPAINEVHLEKWMKTEDAELQKTCLDHSILFCSLSISVCEGNELPDWVEMLVRNFQVHTEAYNLDCAQRELDAQLAAMSGSPGQWQTALVFDADRTLADKDTGQLFWSRRGTNGDPLKAIFSSHLGYSYTAFRQATLLYEAEALRTRDGFDSRCHRIANELDIHPEFADIISQAADKEHVLLIVITCGLSEVWRKAFSRLGSQLVVIGGGRIADGFVVTPEVKAALVRHLRNTIRVRTWAFGDSPLDLPMLREADEAVVVVGEVSTRSRSMESSLERELAVGLKAFQARIPSTAPPRLDTCRLPVIDLADAATVDAILQQQPSGRALHFVHAGDQPSARLLATPTRDASVQGPGLRAAHHRVGWYLAVELVAPVVGLEAFAVPHVQGGSTEGHMLCSEAAVTIVALMRGGEPMALGVSEAFPRAAFLHARSPHDITADHVRGRKTVLLVDSVVNNGKSLVEFVQHVRSLDEGVHIVFIAGVVQSGAVADDGYIAAHVGQDRRLTLVALRTSDNKYTGLGTTDTGNRLFSTTHLD